MNEDFEVPGGYADHVIMAASFWAPGSPESAAMRAEETRLGMEEIASYEREIGLYETLKARAIVRTSQMHAATAPPADDDPAGLKGPSWSRAEIVRREYVSELATTLRVSEYTAQRMVAHSLILDDSPTQSALTHGRISKRHAEIMIDNTITLPEDARYEFQMAALPFAETLTAPKFAAKARMLRERMHPDSIIVRDALARTKRNVRYEPGMDGMAYLTLYATAEDVVAIDNRITDIARALAREEDETRTFTQLRADVLRDLLIDDQYLPETMPVGVDVEAEPASDTNPSPTAEVSPGSGADVTEPGAGSSKHTEHTDTNAPITSTESRRRTNNHRGIRPEVHVTVPVMSLIGQSEEPATLEGYGPIDIDTAKRLVGLSPTLTRILTHPEQGTILSVGRCRYSVPADLRRALEIMNGSCTFPGCNRRARGCDIDHTDEWQHGGETRLGNLAHLCRKHHRMKTLTAWTMKQGPGGTIHWTSPAGNHHIVQPATRMSLAGASTQANPDPPPF